ncbi:MAG: hypothetical protein LBJ67_02900, partial [Planctomycetaceae bacterium]|nr:hypothetical protein [Planctomycetaceae bacterium]
MAKRVGGSALNDVIVLLVTSRDSASVMEYCTKNYGLKASDSEKLVKEAQKRIVLAADYDRREEIGRAVIRFDAIYEECIKSSDSKTALSANIGKCRLLGLYEKEGQVDRTDVGNDREKQ